jgi:hypothetical protein
MCAELIPRNSAVDSPSAGVRQFRQYMANQTEIKDILRRCIGMVVGMDPSTNALGGLTLDIDAEDETKRTIARLFKDIVEGSSSADPDSGHADLLAGFSELEQLFVDYYASETANAKLLEMWDALSKASDAETRAECVTKIFLPELGIPAAEIIPRWRVADVVPAPAEIKPTEVVIQLNALYSPPGEIPGDLAPQLLAGWDAIKGIREEKLADYDHPVALFERDENHELLTCLKELDGDVGFEKQQGVFPADHKVTVLISVSVTHAYLDGLCGHWIESLLEANRYGHLRCIVLTETKIDAIKEDLLGKDLEVFSVLGKYAKHFNALKYTQLILEKGFGIRAGFKLDTDEGIRSPDLFAATGKTWFQTLCHPLWGGTAVDVHGNAVRLDVNEGEYVNKKDIDALGYQGAMRTPDVRAPGSHVSEEIFFNKGFAHGKCTALYNEFDSLDENISHPVVKGGGYGVTNDGLRHAVPFTYSQVGRAEDQQFYFCSLAGGCRGIFHPDLRIAHYKGEGGAVHAAEAKTVATRFVGDMYRLNIFSHLVTILPSLYGTENPTLKFDIDPMPGVFAGPLARIQSYLNLLHKAYGFCEKGNSANARVLLDWGFQELKTLQGEIARGEVDEGLKRERAQWEEFIEIVDAVDPVKAKALLDSFVV